MYKFKLFAVLVMIVLGISAIHSPHAFAQGLKSDTDMPSQEIPQEFTEEAYQQKIDEFYKRHSDFVVVVDLEDPDGIDPKLLPDDVAALVDENIQIVAYKETKRPEQLSNNLALSQEGLCNLFPNKHNIMFGISCAESNYTKDITVKQGFGGVDQYNRVLALRYEGYPPCGRLCYGWEYEQQWAKWERTDSTWTVGSDTAKMRTYSTSPEDFCTENKVNLDYQSGWFTPTWYGNETSWWSISGFPNIAYVPFPTAISETQGDIWHAGSLIHSNAKTQQTFSNTG